MNLIKRRNTFFIIGVTLGSLLYLFIKFDPNSHPPIDKRIDYTSTPDMQIADIKTLPKNTRYRDIVNKFGYRGKKFKSPMAGLEFVNSAQPNELIVFTFNYVDDTINPPLKAVWASTIGGTARWLWPESLVVKNKTYLKALPKSNSKQIKKRLPHDSSSFEQQIQRLEKLTNREATRYTLGGNKTRDVYYLSLPTKECTKILEKYHAPLKDSGAFLFYIGHSYDKLGIALARDQWEAISVMGTDAANYGHDTNEVITWLKRLNEKEPLFITNIDLDLVGGYFLNPVKNPSRLAIEVHDFCPDFYNQGIGLGESVSNSPNKAIKTYFKQNRHFGFWWD